MYMLKYLLALYLRLSTSLKSRGETALLNLQRLFQQRGNFLEKGLEVISLDVCVVCLWSFVSAVAPS